MDERTMIYLDDAIDAIEMLLEQSEDDEHDKTWNDAIRGSINAIKHHVPSAQPEQQELGKWIDQDDGAYYPVECSECRKIPLFDVDGDYMLSNFCPNCGADMRGEEHEND